MKRITFEVADNIHAECHKTAKEKHTTLTAVLRDWLTKKAKRDFPLYVDVISPDYVLFYEGKALDSEDMHGHSIDKKNLSIKFLMAPEGAGQDYNDLLDEIEFKFDTFDKLANFYKSFKTAHLKGWDRMYMDDLIKRVDI